MAEYKPTIKAPGKNGDIIFSALVRLAALITPLLLGGIIVFADLRLPAKHAEIRLRLPVDQE